jgi:LPXTG-motif cell wall-anchored protein
MMDSKYRNWALGDLFYSEKKHEEEEAKLAALNTIANKSATSNTPIYIILGVGIVIMGVIIAVALKKKKAS